jgi:hypothetical protein
MEATHYRAGEKALLSYNVSKGPKLWLGFLERSLKHIRDVGSHKR